MKANRTSLTDASLNRYDPFSYLCCSGNCLRVARRGVAERWRHHGSANSFLNP